MRYSPSCLTKGKTVLEWKFYWIALKGRILSDVVLFRLYIYLHLIFNRSLKRSCPRVLMQLNCEYAARFAIVRNIHIQCLPMWLRKGVSTCCLVLCISSLSKLKRGSASKRREDERTRGDIPAIVTLTKPREFRLCFLSICARLLELFACTAAYINPPQDAFNDTDATRE